MRTTVELPPELMRQAKARAAAQGESLKALFTRAVASELGKSRSLQDKATRVQLPLFGSPGKRTVTITGLDIARALAAGDLQSHRRPQKSRKK
jgi:hypothetical protein